MAGSKRIGTGLLRLLERFLDLHGLGEVVTALGLAGIVGALVTPIVLALKEMPDALFWPLMIAVTLLLAWVIGHFLKWVLVGKPDPAPRAARVIDVKAGDHSPVPIATDKGDATGRDKIDVGPYSHIEIHNHNYAAADQPGEPKGTELPQPAEASKLAFDREYWLAGLASLRNVGVARRNRLLGPLQEDGDPNTTANAIYAAWLVKAVEWIGQHPRHGKHEAAAFETLDRFSMDAAPAPQPTQKYATPVVQWVAAMFSTHLERIEEIRKRYSLGSD